MKLKTLLTTAVTTVLSAAIILPAHAVDGTINFLGSITATTCTISVNGGGANATVSLPVARLDHMKTIGNTTGATDFNVVLSNCTGAAIDGQGVAVHFESGGTVNGNGRLTSSGTATGVELAIHQRDSAEALVLGQAPAAAIGNVAGTGVTLPYTVKYYSTSATPAAGSVASSATYSVVYF